ncbi:hypothetical protein OHB26_02925 [Nocardia sp. NBC_01503]|uniref:hypothetical protein n=1 Tax=Nocardia sp. NBC_01503 TaxID=2975997 RepID=UPI002E7B45ED|nr:hypothetical protein [Nocardia sp. NBC_01503]WTL33223.1 hypothetical protein OHB26_02925 [Nocardia sp. NBC_01503]
MVEDDNVRRIYGATSPLMVTGRAVTDPSELSEREYLALFAKRPGMYIGRATWHGVTGFLEGYNQGAVRHGGRGLDGFREWLITNHLGKESSFSWPGLITQIALADRDHVTPLTDEQQARALAVLFDLLDTFLAEREGMHD